MMFVKASHIKIKIKENHCLVDEHMNEANIDDSLIGKSSIVLLKIFVCYFEVTHS